MGWCCWTWTGKKHPSISHYPTDKTSLNLCWTKNAMERDFTIRGKNYVYIATWNRKNIFSQSMCHRNEKWNLLQYIIFGFNVKICWPILKDFKSIVQSGKTIKAEHYFHWRNWFYCWLKKIRLKRRL